MSETLAAIMADPRVAALEPLPGGGYREIPADPCPCGAFNRDSKWHRAECRDRVAPNA